MSIRNRLTLLFTAIVSVLLAIFCLMLYLLAERHRERIFRDRLRSEALTAGHLLVGRERVGPALYKLMDKNQLTVLPQEEIIIYDQTDRLVYESGTDYLTVTPAILNEVRRRREVYSHQKQREIAGILFAEARPASVIFASGVDTFGRETVQNLAMVMSLGWALMTGMTLIAGYFFAGRVLNPIHQINQRVDEITALQLAIRLPEGPNDDELTQLAQRFNRMLDRLEESFRMQRAFISHASHELRTPLTAITGQLEVSLLADDDPDELRGTLQSVLDDVRGLNRLTNGLMALANANMDASAVPMGLVQLDRLLESVRSEVKRMQPAYSVQLTTDAPSGPGGWQLRGSEALLRTALFNLMENGGKFSDTHTVDVTLSAQPDGLQLRFRNTGPAIPVDQQPIIFSPFRRGRNASGLPGHGIGLSLTERIIHLHQGRISVDSSAEAGTVFTVFLPRD